MALSDVREVFQWPKPPKQELTPEGAGRPDEGSAA